MYDFTIHVHAEKEMDIIIRGEIIEIKETPKTISEELPKSDGVELLLLTVGTHHMFQDEQYTFTTKTYDQKQNPFNYWNNKGGEISDAKLTVDIIDVYGNTWYQISAKTNEWGWYDGKLLPNIFEPGEYSVVFTVEYQNSTAQVIKPLFVNEIERDANYRHFIPSEDLGEVSWNDGRGNNNGLMYDDVKLNKNNPLEKQILKVYSIYQKKTHSAILGSRY